MSSSSGPTMTNPPSDSSPTTAEAEVEEHEGTLGDLSNGGTNSDETKKGKKISQTTMMKRNNKKPS